MFSRSKYTEDADEVRAYQIFIRHLVAKAKSIKVIYEPIIDKEDEKYRFSKFLYRIGLDGNYRTTRTILMKNLEGSALKNLTWKRKKALKDLEINNEEVKEGA